jgi:hypothetical protein
MMSAPATGSRLAGGLVLEEQRRVGDQRACDRDPLRLAPREPTAVVVGPVQQPDIIENLAGSLEPVGTSRLAINQRGRDVLDCTGAGMSWNDWNTNPM